MRPRGPAGGSPELGGLALLVKMYAQLHNRETNCQSPKQNGQNFSHRRAKKSSLGTQASLSCDSAIPPHVASTCWFQMVVPAQGKHPQAIQQEGRKGKWMRPLSHQRDSLNVESWNCAFHFCKHPIGQWNESGFFEMNHTSLSLARPGKSKQYTNYKYQEWENLQLFKGNKGIVWTIVANKSRYLEEMNFLKVTNYQDLF